MTTLFVMENHFKIFKIILLETRWIGKWTNFSRVNEKFKKFNKYKRFDKWQPCVTVHSHFFLTKLIE
jgi:hypothetical protein